MALETNLVLKINLTSTDLQKLKQLQERGNFSSLSQSILYGISVLDWMLEKTENGECVCSYNEEANSYTPLSCPPMDYIKRKAASTESKQSS